MTISNHAPSAINGRAPRRNTNRVGGSRVAVPFILVLIGLLVACGKATPEKAVSDSTAPSSAEPPVVVAVHPDGTDAGKKFNVQASGTSAIAITCQHATNHATIVFAGERLATVYGGPNLLTAEVDVGLFAKAGSYQVYLEDNGVRSNSVLFTVH